MINQPVCNWVEMVKQRIRLAPEELRLRVGEAESLEKRALMVERLGEQIHQAPRDFFPSLGIRAHYRYFTVFVIPV